MRMAELSRRSGVPTATIKYYLREGLVSPGHTTARNQAEYSDGHLERLALIRALREAAGLPIATIARVFAAMDAHHDNTRADYLSVAVGALSEPLTVPEDQVEEHTRAEAQVAELLNLLGWDVDADSPGRDDLVGALAGIHKFLPGLISDTKQLIPYGTTVRSLADIEIPDTYDPAVDRAAVLHFSVLGTVLFEPVILALRRLAHVDRIRHTPGWGTPTVNAVLAQVIILRSEAAAVVFATNANWRRTRRPSLMSRSKSEPEPMTTAPAPHLRGRRLAPHRARRRHRRTTTTAHKAMPSPHRACRPGERAAR